MKKLTFLLSLISIVSHAQIQFESSSWEEALEKARKEQRPIFLDAYATWCEPCKVMEQYTFTDLEVGNFYNKNFINVRLDMEEYPGMELAEEYAVGVYPSFLFFNSNGELMHRGCGSMDASEFLALGTTAKNDTANLAYYDRKYSEGERSSYFLNDYLQLMEISCLNAEQFASEYLGTQKDEDLTSISNWFVISAYQWDIFSREFQYLVTNIVAFADKYGEEQVHSKIYDTYLSQYQEVYESEELHDFGMKALMHSMKQVTFLGSDTLTSMMNLHYAEYTENWEDFAVNAIDLVGMMNLEDPEELSELAWKFYLFIDDNNQLEIASSWAKQAVDQLPDPSIIDTYASLQFKLGKRKEAVELEKRALELAREMYEDTAHYEYQLAKFEGK